MTAALETRLNFRLDPDPARHLFFAMGGGKDFALFNDGPLSSEPFSDEDLVPIDIPRGSPLSSWTWSCNAAWFFVIMDAGIALLNVYSNKGILCRKKTYRFVEAFADTPIPKRAKPADPQRSLF